MKQQRYKIKAAFLFVVFALNTILSFACSVGIVHFSEDHHRNDTTHNHGEVHNHDDHPSNEEDHFKHSEVSHSPGEEEDNCCSDEVVKLNESDKKVTATNQNPVPAISEFYIISLHAFIVSLYTDAVISVKPSPPYLRWQTSFTIPDIRIAIQSFQI